MEQLTTDILKNLFSGYFTNFTSDSILSFFRKAIHLEPSLEKEIQRSRTSEDVQKVFNKTIGIINLNAEDGSIDINSALFDAIKSIKFDHQNGKIIIHDSVIQAPTLQTGGKGSGQTTITGNTSLSTGGTNISVTGGASIKLTGNASLKQS